MSEGILLTNIPNTNTENEVVIQIGKKKSSNSLIRKASDPRILK